MLKWEKYMGSYDAWSGRAAYRIVPEQSAQIARHRVLLLIDATGSGMKYFGEYASIADAKQAAQNEDRRLTTPGARENPLSMNTPEKIAIGVGLLGAAAAAIYYATHPAAAATTPPAVPPPVLPPTTTPPATTPPPATAGALLASGTQTITIPSTGISIMLPSGAKWASGVATPLIGTSNPFIFAAPQSGTHGTLKFSAGWTDSAGSPRMTDLTLNW